MEACSAFGEIAKDEDMRCLKAGLVGRRPPAGADGGRSEVKLGDEDLRID